MAYTDGTEFIERYGEHETIELTDRADPATGFVDYAILDRAINDAADWINGKLQAAGLSVPLATYPPVLSLINSELARCLLYDDQVPDTVAKRCDDAKQLLDELIKSGVFSTDESNASQIAVVAPQARFQRIGQCQPQVATCRGNR